MKILDLSLDFSLFLLSFFHKNLTYKYINFPYLNLQLKTGYITVLQHSVVEEQTKEKLHQDYINFLLKVTSWNKHIHVVGGVIKPCISKILNVLESQKTWLLSRSGWGPTVNKERKNLLWTISTTNRLGQKNLSLKYFIQCFIISELQDIQFITLWQSY